MTTKMKAKKGGHDEVKTCTTCGGDMEWQRGMHRYQQCGLDNVLLVGVEVGVCSACGAPAVAIPNIAGLHKAIAGSVAKQRHRLVPNQIRFLRKYLGFSAKDFAPIIGKTPETVSRWENGQLEMDSAAERLLRLMVLSREPLEEYPLERLADVGGDDRAIEPLRVRRLGRERWESIAAPDNDTVLSPKRKGARSPGRRKQEVQA